MSYQESNNGKYQHNKSEVGYYTIGKLSPPKMWYTDEESNGPQERQTGPSSGDCEVVIPGIPMNNALTVRISHQKLIFVVIYSTPPHCGVCQEIDIGGFRLGVMLDGALGLVIFFGSQHGVLGTVASRLSHRQEKNLLNAEKRDVEILTAMTSLCHQIIHNVYVILIVGSSESVRAIFWREPYYKPHQPGCCLRLQLCVFSPAEVEGGFVPVRRAMSSISGASNLHASDSALLLQHCHGQLGQLLLLIGYFRYFSLTVLTLSIGLLIPWFQSLSNWEETYSSLFFAASELEERSSRQSGPFSFFTNLLIVLRYFVSADISSRLSAGFLLTYSLMPFGQGLVADG
ncbi:hypothetical protein PROFUN_00731 [Planoprotostelium fungivorum]|uniref:Uncharacterized protein n=1 Tax=Planoprotostelium fungivorum TaxID=1890364 RepID=A0A2P6NUC7_9EUKA|nr:hypothetical protein PROFUN_00731 [Planoprotostelium fungivorum]